VPIAPKGLKDSAQGFNPGLDASGHIKIVLVLLRNPTSHAEGLEGSRFTRRQLYRLLAGGSRERLEVRQFFGPL
jgi:hypothetical protein